MATKVFLKARLENLGKEGDEVTVKNGYARNYLIPKGLAVVINDSNKKLLERKTQQFIAAENTLKEKIVVIGNKIVELNLIFTLKVNEKGVAFGSITPANIISRFIAGGIELTQKNLSLTEPLKQIGEHTISISLSPEIKTDFNIHIAAEEDS